MALFGKKTSDSETARQDLRNMQELRDIKRQIKEEKRAQEAAYQREWEERGRRLAEERERAARETEAILISVGTIPSAYEVIDSIYACSEIRPLPDGNDPLDTAFNAVKRILRTKCYSLHGQAVIDCHFQLSNERLFVYGTAVRIG